MVQVVSCLQALFHLSLLILPPCLPPDSGLVVMANFMDYLFCAPQERSFHHPLLWFHLSLLRGSRIRIQVKACETILSNLGWINTKFGQKNVVRITILKARYILLFHTLQNIARCI